MYISMNWIGDFVDLSGLDKEALIRRFTLATAEVEDIFVKGRDTRGVIVAEVAAMENHPNSTKLHLLKINTGSSVVDCVCGAPNVRVGMKVAFATEGGEVCGHPIRLANVAGYESHGMCCSEAELGISADNSGLWEITDDIPLGTDIKSVYDIEDVIFEVDNKSLTNRPDLWGHYGIAREFATLAGRPLKPFDRVDTARYKDLPPVAIDVCDKDLTYRYTGIKVENITVRKSPVNMRIRLYYCGSRAINLLADLTNYVMMELGQPMHAFDLRRVDAIEVKRFDKPFDFKTLDGVTRTIDENMLMICSHGTPVAIAGIMGGLDSEIEDDTTSLLLESANFDGVSVRKSTVRLGLRTDASQRYEKILDPEWTVQASERFLSLLFAIDPGARVISSLTDVYVKHYDTIRMTIDKAFVDRYAGIDISSDRIESTLRALGFGLVRDGDRFDVTVPTWRATKDVTIPADLIEEITRIYGYDNFEIRTTRSPLHPVRKMKTNTDDNRAKDLLVSRYNLHEVHSYIWFDEAKCKDLGIRVHDNVRVINAQTPEHSILRYSMEPTLLTMLAENRGYQSSYGIFEIGHVVLGKDGDGMANEHKMLGIALYARDEDERTLYERLVGAVCALFENLKHKKPVFRVGGAKESWQHPVNTAEILADGVVIGNLSVPYPTVRAAIDKKAAIAFCEIDMTLFYDCDVRDIRYAEASRFPGIDVDLSLVTDLASLDYGEIESVCAERGGENLTAVRLIDTYGGDTVTIRLTFQSHERTLARQDVDACVADVVAALGKKNIKLKA